MSRTLARVAAVLVAVGFLGGGCGSDEPAPTVAPVKVDPALVPPELDGGLTLKEDDKAKDAFSKLPENALVADGRLYAIRQGERLVATLQLATLLPEVDLADPERYDEMVDKLLPGVKEELSVSDLAVYEVAGEDKVVYAWFGRQMFQVLQVKGSKVEPEAVLKQIIGFQQASPAWDPLPEVQEEF